ncbi:small GTP-binding protein domain [Pseudoloma neurophilia]|uniref:Small GTP-binding protein domain n=1 Tax=Pseudoloma neurophilia TaxID=146866 RepID=A0A0R0LSM2_9MICR|nr:small GTP-binding protein domain [Pseudoloma neurophilia]
MTDFSRNRNDQDSEEENVGPKKVFNYHEPTALETDAKDDADSYQELNNTEIDDYQDINESNPVHLGNEEIAPKITFIGSGSTGKTSLIHRFVDNDFNSNCDPTIFENLFISIEIKNFPVQLYVWDTAGQEAYDSIIPLTYKQTSIGVLCYSIADKYSFDALEEKWIRELKYHSPESEVVLIGTKSDLRETMAPEQCISYEEGEELARKLGAIGFFECSAKDGKNCKQVFTFIATHEYHKLFGTDEPLKKKKTPWFRKLFCCA